MILMGSEASLRGGQQGSLYCAAKFGLEASLNRFEKNVPGRYSSRDHPPRYGAQ